MSSLLVKRTKKALLRFLLWLTMLSMPTSSIIHWEKPVPSARDWVQGHLSKLQIFTLWYSDPSKDCKSDTQVMKSLTHIWLLNTSLSIKATDPKQIFISKGQSHQQEDVLTEEYSGTVKIDKWVTVMLNAYDPSTQGSEAEGLEVWGQSGLWRTYLFKKGKAAWRWWYILKYVSKYACWSNLRQWKEGHTVLRQRKVIYSFFFSFSFDLYDVVLLIL